MSPQMPSSCRIYISHGLEESMVFTDHLEGLISEPFANFFSKIEAINSPLSRRLEFDQMPWWRYDIETFSPPNLSMGLFGGSIRRNMKIRCAWHEDGRMFCTTHFCT
jgi:hypothetical protein